MMVCSPNSVRARFLIAAWGFAMCLAVLGCSGAKPTIGKVTGKALSEDKPLPAGTTITFNGVTNSDNFSIVTDGAGEYIYQPPTGVSVPPGDYTVTVTPPGQKVIIVDGLAMPDPKDKATYPQIYPKYASTGTSPLKATVTTGTTTFDVVLKK